jgi:hypothetical protein
MRHLHIEDPVIEHLAVLGRRRSRRVVPALGTRVRILLLAAAVFCLLASVVATAPAAGPPWAAPKRMTVFVDSVLLGGAPALRSAMPDWHVNVRGRPALMIRTANAELRASGDAVSPLVVVGLGYNSLWERDRRNYGVWARRFDGEVRALLTTLRRHGAKEIVWVTLREPSRGMVSPSGREQYRDYAWYFSYVNARLRRIARHRDDVVLADWQAVSDRPGLTYDLIHLNPRGASRMAKVIEDTVRGEIHRQAALLPAGSEEASARAS